MSLKSRIIAFLIGEDVTAASQVFSGPFGVTISTRCGMATFDAARSVDHPGHEAEQRFLRALAHILNRLQPNHCMKAIVADYERAQAVIAQLRPYIEDADKELTK